MIKFQNPSTARFGQTLRFEYGAGMETSVVTAIVIRTSSRNLRGVIECGRNRGDEVDFDILEITGCHEIFGSSVLASLRGRTLEMSWSGGQKTKTREIPEHKPKLSPDFIAPNNVENKRKWHLMKLLGKGEELLCKSTNERAKRTLARSQSSTWKKRYKLLTSGGRFSTFLGAYIGTAILVIGSRHPTSSNPI